MTKDFWILTIIICHSSPKHIPTCAAAPSHPRSEVFIDVTGQAVFHPPMSSNVYCPPMFFTHQCLLMSSTYQCLPPTNAFQCLPPTKARSGNWSELLTWRTFSQTNQNSLHRSPIILYPLLAPPANCFTVFKSPFCSFVSDQWSVNIGHWPKWFISPICTLVTDKNGQRPRWSATKMVSDSPSGLHSALMIKIITALQKRWMAMKYGWGRINYY